VQADSGSTECDKIFVLDLNFGVSRDMPFTTWSGGTSFVPTAIEFIDGDLIRGDSRGYIFRHDDSIYTDPKVDTGVAAEDWNTQVITYDYISAATNFGTDYERKFVPRITLVADNETNLSLLIKSVNDDGRLTEECKPIRFRGNLTWGDETVYWGDPNIIWNYEGIIDEYRRFPAKSLRCSYKQIQLTNAEVAIISSDLIGAVTVDTTAHTATLDDSDFDWPGNIVDYYIAFANDNYDREYLIESVTSDVVTFDDDNSIAPNSAGLEWVIRGKPKGEVLYLQSFTVHYAVFGKTQQAFTNAGTGEVGASDD
jgi:hypothetical protein